MILSTVGILDSIPTAVENPYFWYDPGNTDSYPGTGTTLYDISGNGRNATVNGSPTHVSGFGGYFDFDGVNDYILSANAFNGGNNVHTLEVWIRTSALDECIWSDLGQTTPNASYHFSGCQINNISGIQDRIIVSVWNGSNPDDAVANAQGPADLGTWYQIVRVYDGARVKGYSNGQFTSNGLPEPFDDPTSAWYFAFGHEDSTDILNLPAGMFSGRYGTIRFYNRALSAGEIRKNYEATRPLYSYNEWEPTDANVVTWIDASDSSNYSTSGTTLTSVTDKSGTYTLTVGGTPTVGNTQNGLNVFDFDGNNEYLQSTSYSAQTDGSGNHWAIGVFRYDSTNNTKNSFWSYETNGSPKRDYAISSGASNNTWPGELDLDGLSSNRISSTIGNLQTWTLKSLTRNQYHIVACWFNKTGNQIGVRVDGSNAFTPVNDYDNSIQTNQELRLMRNRASVELDGKLAEFFAVADIPGTGGTDLTDLEKAEGYLAWKWGLVSSLPSGHPYKNNPPTT